MRLSVYIRVQKGISYTIKFDGFVKSPCCPIFVIPAKAGIQLIQVVLSA